MSIPDELIPPEYRIPVIPIEWPKWRRYLMAVRLVLLVKLMRKYHIFLGPQYWQSNPVRVWWEIRQSIKRARPFELPEYDLPPDRPEIAELRKKLRAAMGDDRSARGD